ncbi:MAG: MarR family transcriptional regulator [Actinobacteria bacterium]|nr:MarR family transcriptional regulator [Actinomycetota bacterium]
MTDDARWLRPDQLASWLDLAALMIRLPAALESQLQRDADLSQFEYFVLAHLSESPGREVRMSELAAMSNGSLSRLSHVVSRLERKGWVLRRPSAEDGRSTMAWLTDDGVAKIVASAPGHVERVRDLVVDALTPEQLEALGAACRVVLDRIDARDGESCAGRPGRRPSGRGRGCGDDG